jgi:EAL domain-containing protein (putative c-di-GMP-specific phosphodiesterase class I)
MTKLCRDLGVLVVAEGIETAAERDALLDLGCDLLQGYLFARPGPAFPPVAW